VSHNRAQLVPFVAKVEEFFDHNSAQSMFGLVIQWMDGSDNQPIAIRLGADSSRHRVLTAMKEYVDKELVKMVLDL
jgi:hypothetical protein